MYRLIHRLIPNAKFLLRFLDGIIIMNLKGFHIVGRKIGFNVCFSQSVSHPSQQIQNGIRNRDHDRSLSANIVYFSEKIFISEVFVC